MAENKNIKNGFLGPADEELLQAYASRYIHLRGMSDYLGTSFHMAASRLNSIDYYSIDYIFYYNILIKDEKNITNLIDQHTLLPLLRPTSSIKLNYELLRYCSGEERFLHEIEKGDTVSDFIRVCYDCFNDQIRNYGFSWFKREWAIHGLETCGIHNKKLSWYSCPNCFSGPDPGLSYEKIPIVKCLSCGHDNTNRGSEAAELSKYEDFIVAALTRKYPYFSANLKSFLLNEAIARSETTLKDNPLQYVLTEKKRMRVSTCYNRYSVEGILQGQRDSIVYELFWKIISSGFESFEEFDCFVTENSVYKEIDYVPKLYRDKMPKKKIPVFDC